MSKYRMVNTRFWNDGFVVDELNALDRLLFLYLLTNSKTNITGIYECPLRTIAYETGIDKDDVVKMLKRLEPKVYYINKSWVYITKFLDYQQSNPNINKGINRELNELPTSVVERIQSVGIASERLSKALKECQEPKPKPKPKPKPNGNRLTSMSGSKPDGSLSNKKFFYKLVDILGGDVERTQYTERRRDKLRARLRRYDKKTVLEAAHAVSGDAFLQGDNDRGKVYGDIDYLLRNDEQIDKWSQEFAEKNVKLSDIKIEG